MQIRVGTAPHHQGDVHFQVEACSGITSAKEKETNLYD